MSQKELDKILDAHEAWLKLKKSGKMAVLCGKNMSGLNFSGRMLRHIVMADATLHSANFRGTILDGAILCGSDMWKVDAENASFHGAYLTGVNFRNANLRRADFSRAVLAEATLSQANIEGTIWTKAMMAFRKAEGVSPVSLLTWALTEWKERMDIEYENLRKVGKPEK
jgi:uncharacterized protein YjbI with pentapeptide repeats